MNKEELMKKIPEIKTWEKMPIKEVAKKLGISLSLVYYYTREYPEFYEAIYKEPVSFMLDKRNSLEINLRDYDMPLRRLYDNCLSLGGAVIRNAMLDYATAIFHQLRGDRIYRDRVRSNEEVYTKDELQYGKEFIHGGGLEFWGDGLIHPEVIEQEAQKMGERWYDMEVQAKKMSMEELKEFYRIIKNEIKHRLNKMQMENKHGDS